MADRVAVEPIVLTEPERSKLLKQSCDRGFMLMLKSFIPLYVFRYWNTRLSLGALVWFFFLSFVAAGISSQAYENECRPDNRECFQARSVMLLVSAVNYFAAAGVFGLYGGVVASRARARLKVSRIDAIKLVRSSL